MVRRKTTPLCPACLSDSKGGVLAERGQSVLQEKVRFALINLVSENDQTMSVKRLLIVLEEGTLMVICSFDFQFSNRLAF